MLVEACEFACEIKVLTLIVFGKDMHMVAAISPPDAQLYGTEETRFYFHFFFSCKGKN